MPGCLFDSVVLTTYPATLSGSRPKVLGPGTLAGCSVYLFHQSHFAGNDFLLSDEAVEVDPAGHAVCVEGYFVASG